MHAHFFRSPFYDTTEQNDGFSCCMQKLKPSPMKSDKTTRLQSKDALNATPQGKLEGRHFNIQEIIDPKIKNARAFDSLKLLEDTTKETKSHKLHAVVHADNSKKTAFFFNNLLPEVQNVILHHCDLAELKTMRAVSTHWRERLAEHGPWQTVADSLRLDRLPCAQEEIKRFVLDAKMKARNSFFSSQHSFGVDLSNEINALLLSEKVADINLLKEACQARDTLIVWNQLAKAIEQPEINLSTFRTVKELLLKKEKFSAWFALHQTALCKLQTLWLNRNQLMSLPAEIELLTELRELFLNRNQFTSLPPQIGKLQQLQKLDLNENQIASLSSEIGLLLQLQRLRLIKNRLTMLPPQLGLLTQLKELQVGYNQLTSIPVEIGDLKQLELLWVNDNQLTALPNEVWNLMHLKNFSFENNPQLQSSQRLVLAFGRMPASP